MRPTRSSQANVVPSDQGIDREEWAPCLCAEIDPADVPCIVCDARELQGLPPCDALVFAYGGEWWEFAGYFEDDGDGWDERRYGICLYGMPLDRPLSRPDLPGLIFNCREVQPLTPAMETVVCEARR